MGLTLQDVFNNTWNWHIRDKHMPGAGVDGMCIYYEGDCRCAIGASLPSPPPEQLKEKRVDALVSVWPTAGQLFKEIDSEPLYLLQRAHDTAAMCASFGQVQFHDAYEKSLRAFAAKHNLAVPESLLA